MNKIEDSIKIKYEYSNMINIVKKLDLFAKNYKLIKCIKDDTKKCTCIVEDLNKKKFIMKIKLKTHVSSCQLDIYKKLNNNNNNNNNNVITINKLFSSKNFIIMTYDYIDGFDMSNYNYYNLYTDTIINIYMETLTGLQYLHNLDICHCDMKPDNLLITRINNQYTPVIIDYDLSILNQSIVHDNYAMKKQDIWKTTNIFYYYFFFNKVTVENPFNIIFNNDLIENYIGVHKEFVDVLGWILMRSCEVCPSINDIIAKCKNIV